MKNTEYSIFIDATPEDIYPFLFEKEKMIEWLSTEAADIDFSFSGPLNLGAKIVVMPKKGTSTWKTVEKCKDFIFDQMIKWEYIEGPLIGTDTWILEKNGAGTDMKKIINYDIESMPSKLLWKLKISKQYAERSKEELSNLKRLVEKA